MTNPVIFCDFDGTITQSDNIVSIMKQFAPSGWETFAENVLSQTISISAGVGKMFSLLDSSLKEEMINYIKDTAVIRSGFAEFVHFTNEQGIPLFIVSGGMDFFIEPLLDGLLDQKFIYCNRARFDKEKIIIEWPHSCDSQCKEECGCCKPSVMRRVSKGNRFNIVIGDSVTDFAAAKQANLVIARDRLLEKCKMEGIPHVGFQDFFHVIEIIQKQLEVKRDGLFKRVETVSGD